VVQALLEQALLQLPDAPVHVRHLPLAAAEGLSLLRYAHRLLLLGLQVACSGPGRDHGAGVGACRLRTAHVLQLPSELLHLGHGHGQLLLLFAEQGPDRVQL
ncbi:unnamed protein product, partial [Ixodes persulcatus]